ncbi:valine--tRNA ligase [Ileibacterium valens]|uniref:Valine--tRNA ligase n=1 Tax=Ileibacterium valens TaxID=1862668 RepID=A0A1U7NFX4_9FIRM|nr:valine--tRNA ligase [Ileibacterium valens]OLU38253.1 valine--tRNA ligase [Erysipelotrichaceae bacterium NYU-BL-E8]OLU39563.1 valine--tRNA ligase [Ileibacterium valens]OLU40284.1 valine--tRNA ligase [Erysipelotrichaceae bacterium NYU-BL-F16]
MSELSKKYDHHLVENPETYQNWIEKGYFTAGDQSKIPYSIVIPPPNVTGKLHLGHALDTAMQDILSRYKRAQGFDVLWLSGMDHAGIATQAKVDARLQSEGISRYDIGREKFLERAWEWKEEYASHIREQWAKLGLSLDYSRERFTLDDGLNDAVLTTFVNLYNEGLIYQGERIINWDPQARTALSNIEVIHEETPGKMYYFKYPVQETGDELIIATTRPETMFADQAVFVHPDDERYKKYVGLHVLNPVNNEALPIMADDYIDLDFGTAVMKCTPAHDPNDFNLAKKYNLKMPVCMNPDGTMNELAGKYKDMDRFECRKAVVADLDANGMVDHIEDHPHMVGHSERTGVIVEPYLSKQWFVRMKPLADAVLEAQKGDQKIDFIPPRFSRTFEQWLENIEDWCISRQLWWGHRIPAWFHKETGEIYVGKLAPEDIENWKQDEDVLDTWFSSGLWPFATMGWPEETDDYQRYYPTDVLVTGYDIIFFWVARMAFQARFDTNNRPFKEVLIHGLIRDPQGRKMSKSLGNGIDPMDVIEEKGADALRFFLTTNSTPGQDFRYDPSKVDAAWNFINKIWNASRYVQMQIGEELPQLDLDALQDADLWILSRLNETIESATQNLDRYELAIAANEVLHFAWDDFCSWYIELSKAALNSKDEKTAENTKAVLAYVLKQILILLSPYMPFVTEHIYQNLPYEKESIQLESWPAVMELPSSETTVENMTILISAIEAIREIKRQYNLKPKEIIEVRIEDENGSPRIFPKTIADLLEGMAKVHLNEELSGDLLSRNIHKGLIRTEMSSLINLDEEKAKLEKLIEKLEKEVARSEKMLSNPGFTSKAPAAKIEAEETKLKNNQEQLALSVKQLEELIAKMQG